MSDARFSHDELREMTALYAVGTLGPAEKTALESHLATCPECTRELRSLMPAVGVLAGAVPQVDPPPALRSRVLSSVAGVAPEAAKTPDTSRGFAFVPWLAAAACLVAAVGLGMSNTRLRGQLFELDQELNRTRTRLELSELEIANARRAAGEAQAAVLVISAPDLRRSDLAGQAPVAPNASARALWSRSRGLIFAASDLPQLPAGQTYQLWIVPAAGAPVSAGLFQPDANGQIQAIVTTPIDAAQAAAMALTNEPAGGVPAPTGSKYLVGTVGL